MSVLPRVLVFCALISLISCIKNTEYKTDSFYALGTVVNITLPKEKSDLSKEAYKVITLYEKKLNDFAQKFNDLKVGSRIPIDFDIFHLFKTGEFLYDISNGSFDITIRTLTVLYGFPDGPFGIPCVSERKSACERVGFDNILFDNKSCEKKSDVMIDFGAYGKGYIVDKAVELLKKRGVKNGIVDAGGDLYVFGNKNGRKWRIAIKNPDSEGVLSIVKVSDMAVVTSGDYERFFIDKKTGRKIIHIFDARKCDTADNYKSVSVIAENTEMADGLSTVFFLLKINEIKSLCEKLKTPVLIYTLDNRLIKLCGWQQYED